MNREVTKRKAEEGRAPIHSTTPGPRTFLSSEVSTEQKDTVPAVQKLHPGGSHSREPLAPGGSQMQDHRPQVVKEGGQVGRLVASWVSVSRNKPRAKDFHESGLSRSAPERNSQWSGAEKVSKGPSSSTAPEGNFGSILKEQS